MAFRAPAFPSSLPWSALISKLNWIEFTWQPRWFACSHWDSGAPLTLTGLGADILMKVLESSTPKLEDWPWKGLYGDGGARRFYRKRLAFSLAFDSIVAGGGGVLHGVCGHVCLCLRSNIKYWSTGVFVFFCLSSSYLQHTGGRKWSPRSYIIMQKRSCIVLNGHHIAY